MSLIREVFIWIDARPFLSFVLMVSDQLAIRMALDELLKDRLGAVPRYFAWVIIGIIFPTFTMHFINSKHG